jgi:hypothetical protein
VLRAVDKSSGFSLGGPDCTHVAVWRGGPSTWRLSERTDEQELRMHGDGTEGGSQGSRAVAGCGEEASNAFRQSNNAQPRIGNPGW